MLSTIFDIWLVGAIITLMGLIIGLPYPTDAHDAQLKRIPGYSIFWFIYLVRFGGFWLITEFFTALGVLKRK